MGALDYLKEMRPKHWYKAVIVLTGPFFSGKIMQLDLYRLLLAFLSFILISSHIYVINDIKDKDRDRLHPKKKNRPIASGKITVKSALLFSFILLLSSLALAYASNLKVLATVLIYDLLMLLYTFKLKERAVIDAFVIAFGYLLRAVAGCFATQIQATTWFYLVIFSFAVYLAFCKRLAELKMTDRRHKESLKEYEKMVEIGVSITGSMSLALYALYSLSKGGTIIWSVPVAILGVLLHLRESMNGKEVHESLKSPEIMGTIFLFIIIIALSIYG